MMGQEVRRRTERELHDEVDAWQQAYAEALALLERVDNATPPKRGSYVFAALVPWDLIMEVRAFIAEGKTAPSSDGR